MEEYSFELSKLQKMIPEKIKLEILKSTITEIYKEEVETKKYLDKNQIKSYEDITLNTLNRNVIVFEITNLYVKYKQLFERMEILKLSEESSIQLYQWAKTNRKELGLSDNLYNIFEMFIGESIKYEDINEKVNKKQKF